MNSRKLSAAVDLGTNSFILTVVDEKGNVIFESLVTTALGNAKERLPIKIKRAKDALNFFTDQLKKLRVEKVYIFGTQFFRKNPEIFELILQGAQYSEFSAFEARILTEREEALFSYFSIESDPIINLEKPVVVDIGGGSVEIIFESAGDIVYRSYEIGVWRLTNKFVTKFPIGHDVQKQMEEFIKKNVERESPRDRPLVGIGGTFVALAAMYLGKSFDSFEKLNGTKIPMEWLRKTCEKLFELELTDIEKINGLPKNRSKLIPAGSLLVSVLLKTFSKSNHYFVVSSKGCRYTIARFGFDILDH